MCQMKYHEILDGKFSVELDLNCLLSKKELGDFKSAFDEIRGRKPISSHVYGYENGILRYQSETLLPKGTDQTKNKVLLVFGNPATHSVQNGMFFFSKGDCKRHSMWGKLSKAGLVKEFSSILSDQFSARQEEAMVRREMILNGLSSEKYLVGMTTFYSFPTPVENGFKYSNALGVERLFRPIIGWLIEKEAERILSYPFTKGAQLVFVQKSSFDNFKKVTRLSPVWWPVRGRDSSGGNLADIL